MANNTSTIYSLLNRMLSAICIFGEKLLFGDSEIEKSHKLLQDIEAEDMSTLDNVHEAQVVAAVKAAVEPQIEKLCENELLFKDSETSRREVLNAVYAIYREATLNNGIKMWRAWDTFDKDTHTCTITVDVFVGNETVTFKHVVGLTGLPKRGLKTRTTSSARSTPQAQVPALQGVSIP